MPEDRALEFAEDRRAFNDPAFTYSCVMCNDGTQDPMNYVTCVSCDADLCTRCADAHEAQDHHRM